jgi:methylmalonyl-CoA/ethylmalonyl-CoA epimerase
MFKKIDHIGIAVSNLDKSLQKYKKMFNIDAKFIETLEDLGVRIAFVPVGEVMLELVEPLVPGKGRIGLFLERNGEGFHHIAYRVENLSELVRRMQDSGIALRDKKPRSGAAGAWIAFLEPEETNNVLTELVEREQDL